MALSRWVRDRLIRAMARKKDGKVLADLLDEFSAKIATNILDIATNVALLAKERLGPWDEPVFADLRPIEVHRDQGAGSPDSEILTEHLRGHAYDKNTAERITYLFHVTHKFRKGSRPVFHVHTCHNIAVPTGTKVRWKTYWHHARGYGIDTFGAAGVVVAATQTPIGAMLVHEIFGEDDLACPEAFVATIEPDSLIAVVLERDTSHADEVADGFAHDFFGLTADLHVERERDGTTERNRPFTSAGY